MSAARRSVRARKQVDYSLDSPNNSDDDFQDSPSGPPPSKKPKTTIKIKPTPKQDETKTKDKPMSSKKERLSPDEKIYQRQIGVALEASLKDSQSSEETKENPLTSDEEQPRTTKEKTMPSVSETDDSPNKENENSEAIKGMSHEEVVASIDKKPGLDSKTASSTEQEETKSDEDNNNEDLNEEDNESDYEVDGDSDFDEEKERKKTIKNDTRKAPAQPSPTKVGIKPRTSVTVTPIKMLKNQEKKALGSSKGSSIKSLSSADSGSVSNSPQIYLSKPKVLTTSSNFLTSSCVRKSPGTGLGSVKIQPSGGLRLGLSRNVRVKPLLSKLSVHP